MVAVVYSEADEAKMLKSKRLVLSRKRWYSHYEAPIWVGIICVIILLLRGNVFFSLFKHFTRPMLFAVLMLLSLPLLGVATFINQYRMLRLKTHSTGLNKEKNHTLALKVIDNLKWKIKIDQPGFVQAFNPFGDMRTWGNEMISIVITDERILINSICNVDDVRSQAAFSFGKNKQNVRKFLELFDLFAEYV